MKLFSSQALKSFSHLDYEIYNFIIKNSDKISYMTIRELAKEAHVSTTTITRFCKKLNCDGFSEFKVRYKMELDAGKKQKEAFDSSVIIDFFHRVSMEKFQNELNEIANVIASRKHVIFMGVGNSGIVAEYASRYFSNMGIFSTGINDPMFPMNIEFPDETILIVLSVEGETNILVENSGLAKRSRVTTVSITNSKNSTLAKMADYNVSYYIQKELTKENEWGKVDLTSQIPAMHIVEILAKLTLHKKLTNEK